MVRSPRPKPDDVVSVCYGIQPKTNEVVTFFGRRNLSYSIGDYTYSNEHRNPVEFEAGLINGLTDIFCVHVGQMNDETTEQMVAALREKAAKREP